jgi:tetratricopeptide (TPR) repeat protein
MASFTSRQWIAVAGGVIVFASLFYINRKAPAGKDGTPMATGHASQAESFDSLLAQAENEVPASFKSLISKVSSGLSTASQPDKEKILNQLVGIYDSAGAHIPATFFTEKLATLQNTPGIWFEAGDRYYKSADVLTNATRITVLERAKACFNNALKLDTGYTDARVGLAECMVQGQNPMQGIMMLEAIIKKDSNDEKAQIALGEFSIQSGQYPKAIMRFKKVLKIDPSYSDAYLYLAQACENSGDKKSAISYLEKYSTFAKDSVLKNQVNSYIAKLKSDSSGK